MAKEYKHLADLPHIQTEEEEKVATDTIQLFSQLQTQRASWGAQCEEIASLVWTETRNTFFFGSYNWPGLKLAEKQMDSTGQLALYRFSAIMESLLTPGNSKWHSLTTTDPSLNRNRNVQLWFEQVNNILFQQRYAPNANFVGNQNSCYLNLGAFGTMAMMVEEYDDPVGKEKGLRYIAVPMGSLFMYTNHQGKICGFIRWFKLTAQQAFDMFGAERFPEQLRASLENQSQTMYDFLHHCGHRHDYDEERIDYKGKPWRSDYVCMLGSCVVRQGGYRSFPLAVGRWQVAPNEVYGRSVASSILGSLKTLNLAKRIFLKAGHRAADPVLLTGDDGLLNQVDLRPGAINPGGVDSQGRLLVHPLPIGNVQITKEMMEEERNLVNDAFLITLFQILTETPSMTATESLQRAAEKSILLSPSVERQQAEYLGSLIDRELDILSSLKLLPPAPKELHEARGEYHVIYSAPLFRSMKSMESASFMRLVDSAIQIVNATGDSSLLDQFAWDRAIPDMAANQAIPPSWLSSPQEVKAKAQARAQAQAKQQAINALPNQAAMVSAQAKAAAAQKITPDAINQPGTGGPSLGVAGQGKPSFGGPG